MVSVLVCGEDHDQGHQVNFKHFLEQQVWSFIDHGSVDSVILSITHERETRKFKLNTMSVFWNGEESFMHIFSDITKIQEAEQERSRSHFQRMMMSNVSHEYRTPLNAIITSTEIVTRQLNNLIETATGRLLARLNQIKTQVSIESSSSKLMLCLVNEMIQMGHLNMGRFVSLIKTFTLTVMEFEIWDLFA